MAPSNTSTTPKIPNADKTMEAYHCTNIWSKSQRFTASGIEWVGAGLAAWAILFDSSLTELWKPLVAMAMTLVSVVVRQFGDRNHQIAQHCRRLALQAGVSEVDVKDIKRLMVCEEIPWFAWRMKIFVKKENLSVWGYYGPYATLPEKGVARMRYMTAYSSFFTWKITEGMTVFFRVLSWLSLVLLIFALYLVVATYVNSTAASAPGTPSAPKLDPDQIVKSLDIICTVIIAFLVIRLFRLAGSSKSTANTCKRITTDMVQSQTSDSDRIKELAIDYEFERVTGKQPSTIVYWIFLSRLEAAWISWKEAKPQ